MIKWDDEWPLIKACCTAYGVNAYFVAAIRVAENGNPGREFGVLSTPAPTYADQLRITCETVAHRLTLFAGNAHARIGKVSVQSRAFVDWFAQIWAPGGASNDPTDLNANWASNVLMLQNRFAANGHPG